MTARAHRIGQNQSLFRAVNEHIEDLAIRSEQTVEIVCECSSLGCAERLTVALTDYEAVRGDGRRFIVTQGHQNPDFERIVERRDGWLVVEKSGDAGDTAADENPRDDRPVA